MACQDSWGGGGGGGKGDVMSRFIDRNCLDDMYIAIYKI